MSMHRVATFSYGGYELAYEVHGTGEDVVVLVHGILLDANLNRSLAQSLAQAGYRVVLLDLLGHGLSDRPTHAMFHRIDSYAAQVEALLDELGVAQAVVGGVSLGANVSLQLAVQLPDRVRALIVEMPVLEWAAPAAALTFVPLLLAVRYGRPIARLVSLGMRRVPRTRFGPLDSVLNAASASPEEIAAVLHGLLVGPLAPSVEERSAITTPALIIGHERDLIHPFNDAVNLSRELPNARFVQASSVFELRVHPTRLTQRIVGFLDEITGPEGSADASDA